MHVNQQQFKNAMDEIERDAHNPLEKRGGETLEAVNDVFNLMAMKI